MTSYAEQIGDVVHNLLGGGTAVMLGGMYFIPGMRFGWFHTEVPAKLQLEYYYVRIFRGFKWICFHPISAVADVASRVIPALFTRTLQPLCNPISKFAAWIDHFVPAVLTDIWLPLCTPISKFAAWVDHFVPALLTDIWLPLSNPITKFAGWIDHLISSLLTDIWLPLSKPISKLSAFIDDFISATLTDTWLPLAKPISKLSEAVNAAVEKLVPIKTKPTAEAPESEWEPTIQEEPSQIPTPAHLVAEGIQPDTRFSFKFERPRPKKENPWQLVVARLYLIFSGGAAKFDFKVVDGIINGISRMAHGISRISQSFDTHVIDKLVNGTAKAVDYGSDLFKRTQTGRIQNYLLAILLGMLAIITLYLLVVFDLIGI